MKKKMFWAALLLALLALFIQDRTSWPYNWPSYYREQRQLQKKVIDPDHEDNKTQMGQDIIVAHEGRQPNQLSMDDIEKDRQAVLPSANRAYKIDLIAREWEATAKGQTLSHPPNEIKGNMWHWMRTDIPILGCMKITASGQIWSGEEAAGTKAGPDGVTGPLHEMFRNMTTVVPGLPWGTFIGKVCDEKDTQGEHCGVRMPLGSMAYRSPNQFIAGQQVGAGVLWVWTNQFGTETDRSDYNAGQGGFTFDAEAAPADMCDAVTTVASR